MKETPLFSFHQNNDGKIVDYAGWAMPLHYKAGAIKEHHIVRQSMGLFDVSHMGRFSLEGPDSLLFLNDLLSSNISKIDIGSSGYALLLNEKGTVIDDLFLYHLEDTKWLIVVNASNLEKDWNWFCSHTKKYDLQLKNISHHYSLLALQGPKVIPALQSLDILTTDIPRFGLGYINLDQLKILVARTGYTGEDGFELFVPSTQSLKIWNLLLDKLKEFSPILPCGLASRDSLRFEASFPLYGHEISDTVYPPEALLKWACDFKKDFIGAEPNRKLIENGLSRKLVSFTLKDKGVPREGYEVYSEDETRLLGIILSGMFCPTLESYCGNALISIDQAKIGNGLKVKIRGKFKRATIEKRPLYIPSYRKKSKG